MREKRYIGKEQEKFIWISDEIDFLKEKTALREAVLLLMSKKNKMEDASFCRYAIESKYDITEDYLEEVYNRFHGIPRIIVTTLDFTIREMKQEDIKELEHIFKEESEGFIESFFTDVEEGKAYLNQYIQMVYEFYGFGIWGMYCSEEGKLIGIVGFTPRKESLEIGFVIKKNYRRKGYMCRACREIISYIEKITDYKTIEANINNDNVASIGLLRKLGFQRVGEIWKKEL